MDLFEIEKPKPRGYASVPMAQRLVALLAEYDTMLYMNERDMQDGFTLLLDSRGVPYEREATLPSGAGRIDFRFNRVGLEMKMNGSLADLTRQLHRYAECGEFDVIVLASSRARLTCELWRTLPHTTFGGLSCGTLASVPIIVKVLGGLFGDVFDR